MVNGMELEGSQLIKVKERIKKVYISSGISESHYRETPNLGKFIDFA